MKKIQMLLLCTGLMLSSASGCHKERNESSDDKLTLKRVENIGNELKINGYYYHKYVSDSRIQVFFLYRNGIIVDAGVSNSMDEVEEKSRNGFFSTHLPKYKYSWGVFQITGIHVKFEKWVPSEGPLGSFTYEGLIINDTSFVINQSYRIQNGHKTNQQEINLEYHFKQFTPKPDSTNQFIP